MLYLDLHTHSEYPLENTLAIRNQYPLEAKTNTYFSTGIHPWYFTVNDWEEQLEELEHLVLHKNCVAIGECGIDRNISTDFYLQQLVFEKHIPLSEKNQKPLIIHCVGAYAELVSIKKKYNPLQDWIVHGFNKNVEVASMLLKNNIKLSFGKALLTNSSLQEIFKTVPNGYYFLETDDADIPISELYIKARQLKKEVDITFSNPSGDFLYTFLER